MVRLLKFVEKSCLIFPTICYKKHITFGSMHLITGGILCRILLCTTFSFGFQVGKKNKSSVFGITV